jgi:hypothetical protein
MRAACHTTKEQREELALNGRKLIEDKYADSVIVKQYMEFINKHMPHESI